MFEGVFTREYKNAVIEVVIEDDAITMGRVFIDEECIDAREFTTSDGGDVPFTKANYDEVLNQLRGIVDEAFEESLAMA